LPLAPAYQSINMHIVIDIRTLQPNSLSNRPINDILKKWLNAFLRMPYEHRVTLLIDPRLQAPVLNAPSTGAFWQTIAFESHPELSPPPSRESEELACYRTNQFLLEHKADLFHIPKPFEFAPVVGYPPSVCRSVSTVDSASSEQLFEHDKDSLSASLSTVKLQALAYYSRVLTSGELMATGISILTRVPEENIDIISYGLSSREIALVIRQTYSKALTSPSIDRIPATNFAFSKLATLATQADIADRDYTIQSQVPVIGALIAWTGRNITSHLREAYFDLMIERQVLLNQKLIELFDSICQSLTKHEEMIDLLRPQTSAPINIDFLADPLLESGDNLEQDLYDFLYSPDLTSVNSSRESQIQTNQSLITVLEKLKERIEEDHKQKGKEQELIVACQSMIAAHTPLLELDIMIRRDKIQSTQKKGSHPEGKFIAWARRHLTSHLRELYLDPTLEKQVLFNRSVIKYLNSNLYAISSYALSNVSHLSYIKRPYNLMVGNQQFGGLIAWLGKKLTENLRELYIEPIFERQITFNRALIDFLGHLNQLVALIYLKEHYNSIDNQFEIEKTLNQVKKLYLSNKTEADFASHASAIQSSSQRQIYTMIDLIEAELEKL
jgi:hypothetical protein